MTRRGKKKRQHRIDPRWERYQRLVQISEGMVGKTTAEKLEEWQRRYNESKAAKEFYTTQTDEAAGVLKFLSGQLQEEQQEAAAEAATTAALAEENRRIEAERERERALLEPQPAPIPLRSSTVEENGASEPPKMVEEESPAGANPAP